MNDSNQSNTLLKDTKRKVNRRLSKMKEDLHDYKGSCLFVVDDNGAYCNKPVHNKCHIVPNAKVLQGLSNKNGQVVVLEWGIAEWRNWIFSGSRDSSANLQDPAMTELPYISHNDACVGWFACELLSHDREFQKHGIDVADPNFSDPEIRFLVAYRLELFRVDQYRLAMNAAREWRELAMRSSDPRKHVLWASANERIRAGFQKAEATAMLLGKNWYARKTGGSFDADLVSARVLEFRSRLRFAGCVFYGKNTATNIFPVQGDWHKMAVLYLTHEAAEAEMDIEHLAEVTQSSKESDDYGVTVAKELMGKGWGTLAASPESYEGLDEQSRSILKRLAAEHSGGAGMLRSYAQQSAGTKPRWRPA